MTCRVNWDYGVLGDSNMFCNRWKFEKTCTVEKVQYWKFAKKRAEVKIYETVKVNVR